MKNYATRYTYLDKEKEHTPKEQKEKNENRRSKRKEERKCRRISTLLLRGYIELIIACT
jgi:hypothetical protein